MIRIASATDLGPVLRDLRLLQGLSQRALAKEAGTYQSMICHYGAGQHIPDAPTVAKVLAALGYDLALIPREDA